MASLPEKSREINQTIEGFQIPIYDGNEGEIGLRWDHRRKNYDYTCVLK